MARLQDLAGKIDEHSEVNAQMKEAFEIFQKMAYNTDDDPILCELHTVFESHTASQDETPLDHNCLGCNFADSINLIAGFLEEFENQNSIQFSHTTGLMLFYLLVERMDTLLSLVKLNDEIRKEDFKILTEVRKWANFLKHPKAFILVHHPVFTYEGANQNPALKLEASVCVDYTFVQKYYSNDDKNDDLLKALANKEDVLVIYPPLPRVAKQICEAMSCLIALLRDNAVFRRILKQKSTFTGYWLPSPPGTDCPT